MDTVVLDDILTAGELALHLKINERHVKNLARQGKIPAKKIGREWRFKVSEVIKWFADWQPNTFDPNEKAGEIIRDLNGQKKKGI